MPAGREADVGAEANRSFFEILCKFLIQNTKTTAENGIETGDNAESRFRIELYFSRTSENNGRGDLKFLPNVLQTSCTDVTPISKSRVFHFLYILLVS